MSDEEKYNKLEQEEKNELQQYAKKYMRFVDNYYKYKTFTNE